LGRCKQKQRGLRGLLCRWPSITEWEMHITAQGSRLRNDLYCVEWDVKLYYTISYRNNFVHRTHRFGDIRLGNIPWPWNPG